MYHLVTGSSGYLGSLIVKKLVKMKIPVKSIDVIEDDEISKISKFKKIDISNYNNELIDFFSDVVAVHHNAALVPLTKSGKKFFDVNVKGTENVLNAAVENKTEHFSHMSSSAIFSKPNKNQNVNYHKRKPTSLYGNSKYQAELIVENAMTKKIFKSCSIIRPRPIIGETRLGIFEILFDWVKDGKKIPIIGNGNNIFQFANDEDLVDVSIETAIRNLSGFYNIGNEIYSTLNEDLNTFFSKVNSKSKTLPIPNLIAVPSLFFLDKLNLSPLSSWHYLSYSWNFYYEQKENYERLNWRPKKSNIELLCKAYEWYLNNEKTIKINQSPHRKKIKQKMLKVVKMFL